MEIKIELYWMIYILLCTFMCGGFGGYCIGAMNKYKRK